MLFTLSLYSIILNTAVYTNNYNETSIVCGCVGKQLSSAVLPRLGVRVGVWRQSIFQGCHTLFCACLGEWADECVCVPLANLGFVLKMAPTNDTTVATRKRKRKRKQ